VTEAVRAVPLIQSIERAASVLGFFTPDEPELTLADITERLKVVKGTAHRYAMALRRVGLLRYDKSRAVYTLGPRIIELGASAYAGLKVASVAAPFLRSLVSEINETVVLSVWDEGGPVVVHVEDNVRRIVRIVVRNGTRLPMDSAQGRIFAAFMTTPPKLPAIELKALRKTGVAFNSSVVEGITAAAAPIFQEREIVAAIAVVGTAASIPRDPDVTSVRRLRETAQLISADLGVLPLSHTR
jgi:DNA-binding IclR family transcriptional regulator